MVEVDKKIRGGSPWTDPRFDDCGSDRAFHRSISRVSPKGTLRGATRRGWKEVPGVYLSCCEIAIRNVDAPVL